MLRTYLLLGQASVIFYKLINEQLTPSGRKQ